MKIPASPAQKKQAIPDDLGRPTLENERLREREKQAFLYVRAKVNQLLQMMGTVPLRPEELDDDTLINLDPIGIISESFAQVLENLRRTNMELQVARDELKAIFDSVGGGILVLDEEMRVLAYNRKMEDLFVKGAGMATGQSCNSILCSQDVAKEGCILKDILTTKKVTQQSNWTCNGHHYDVVGTPVLDKDGEIAQIVMLYMDITRRKNMERALRESEEEYRDLFENASDIIQILQPNGRFMFVNKAWQKTFGYNLEEIKGMDLGDLVDPETKAHCMSVFSTILAQGSQEKIETKFRTKQGDLVSLEGSASTKSNNGKPVSVRCIFRDVTEKKKLEEEVMRAQKLESLGILAGGIAHDFNNLLTAILGNASLARMQSEQGSQVEERLADVEKATLQAQGLTQQLLTFSKGGAPVKRTASLPELITDSANFVLSGASVSCTYQFAADLWPVDADVGQISQVIHNLVLNSSQAMPEGGTITISAENVPAENVGGLPLAEGQYVKLTVADRGVGIPASHLAKIFDPYFSTKQRGSGLGLASSYSIIKSHGGHMSVESRLGQGARFFVYLPAVAGGEKPVVLEETNPLRGKGNILIMDDEPLIRDVLTQMLISLGYDVIATEDGHQAVARYRQALAAEEPFAAVIMDLTIPGGMGGKEAIGKLLAIDPRARVIVSSGYANDPVMSKFQEYGFSGVVPKPYRLAELSRALHSVMAGS